MHLGDEFIHASELLGRCLDHEIDAFADHIELRVSDKYSYLDENVFFEGKPRHLTINPDQMGEFDGHSAQFRGSGAPSVNSE